MEENAPNKIVAAVVTYNRVELLLECIKNLYSQTYDFFDVVIVDNASTDGTEEVIKPLIEKSDRLHYVNTGSNLGGAGGFNFACRYAVEHAYEYVWLMDDDCMPTPTALEELVSAGKSLDNHFGFLSSKALWKDGTICTMNVQRETLTKNVEDFSRGLVPVAMASFVSLFVPVSVIEDYGLPIKDFFIWTDDWEFTRRISRKIPSYLVTKSIVVHKSASNIGANIATDSADRLNRFNYLYRNDVYLYRREGKDGFMYEAARLGGHAARVLLKAPDNKRRRLKCIVKGTKQGLQFNPKIEFASKQPNKRDEKKLRVLELFGEPISFGGQESIITSLVEHMDKEGLEIDFLTLYYCDNQTYRARVKKWGGTIYELNCEFKPGANRELVRKPLDDFLAKHHYDVVHIHSGSTSVFAIASQVAKKHDVPLVIAHSHASLEHVGIKNVLIRELAAKSMKKTVDEYCACSKEAGVKFSEDVQKHKLSLILNGIDVKTYAPNEEMRKNMRKKLGYSKGTFVLGHIGRFCDEKNHPFIIEVFKELLKSNADARLLLVGEGDSRKDIKNLVEDEGLQEYVTFAGAVTNPQDYLQAFDVCILPSKFEGFPMVSVEAQAAGVPFVASCAVSKGIQISDLVSFCSLENGPKVWAQEILKARDKERISAAQAIKNAGFDITQSAQKVRAIYLGAKNDR